MANNDQNMLQELTAVSTIAEHDIAMFTSDELYTLGTYIPEMSRVKPSEKVVAYYQSRRFSAQDRMFILAYRTKKLNGTIVPPHQIEEAVHARKGEYMWGPESLTITYPGKAPEVIYRQPIQVVEPLHQVKLQIVSVWVSTFFDIQQGCITQVGDTEMWKSAWGHDSCSFDPSGLPILKGAFEALCKKDSSWEDIQKPPRRTIQGPEFVHWVTLLLDRAGESYLDLCHVLATHCTRAVIMERKNGYLVPKSFRAGPDGVPLHPNVRSISHWNDAPKLTAAIQAWRARNDRKFIMLMGPLNPRMLFKNHTTPSLIFAYKAMQEGELIRGGVTRGLGALTQGRDFSGPSAEGTRIAIVQVSIVYPLLARGELVDLDLPLGQLNRVFATFKSYKLLQNDQLRFVLSKKDMLNAPKFMVAHCCDSRRSDAINVWIGGAAPPTLRVADAEKRETVTAQAEQYFRDKKYEPAKRFIMHCSVYCRFFFETGFVFKGPNVDRFGAFWTSESYLDVAGRGPFMEGEPREFLVRPSTTTANANPIGAMMTSTSKSVDQSVSASINDVRRIPLVKYETIDQLFTDVILANKEKCQFFLAPRIYYHPWSNILRPPPDEMMMVLQEGEWNLVNIAEYPVEPVQRKVIEAPIDDNPGGVQAVDQQPTAGADINDQAGQDDNGNVLG